MDVNLQRTPLTRVTLGDLPRNQNTYKFEGHLHGNPNLSFFLVNASPGGGSAYHEHPYQEVHVVLEGTGTYVVDGQSHPVQPGDILVVPAGMPHRFVNTSQAPLKLIGIHESAIILQTNLDDPSPAQREAVQR
jgi:mannose-6-phosphate isomerase-like protein (cupin superfamily)